MQQILDLEKLTQISHDIDAIAEKYNTDYLEATLLYCEEHNIEIEAIAEYIKKNNHIKSKVEQSAEDLNYIKKKVRLEI